MKKKFEIKPSKIIAVGLNYMDHAKELNMQIPKNPIIFLKPQTSIIKPGENIHYPKGVKQLDYEAELAVIIKDKIKNISPGDSEKHILGYTCANDVTARDIQNLDVQWTRAKSFDTFCPIGPVVTDEIDPDDVNIKLYLNGKMKQSGNTKNMIFKVFELVSFISKIMTLLPGDVILTGTPKGVGPMKKGDKVEVEIDGIGKLTNHVR